MKVSLDSVAMSPLTVTDTVLVVSPAAKVIVVGGHRHEVAAGGGGAVGGSPPRRRGPGSGAGAGDGERRQLGARVALGHGDVVDGQGRGLSWG